MTRLKPRAKAPRSGRTEAQVLAGVLDAARVLGVDLQRQNTGGAVNPKGRLVMFGRRGNSDLTGMLPDGRRLDVEVKREGWDPAKARGATADRWALQLARLQRTNAQGGVGFWVDDAAEFLELMRLVLDGARVVEHGTRLEVFKRDSTTEGPRC